MPTVAPIIEDADQWLRTQDTNLEFRSEVLVNKCDWDFHGGKDVLQLVAGHREVQCIVEVARAHDVPKNAVWQT